MNDIESKINRLELALFYVEENIKFADISKKDKSTYITHKNQLEGELDKIKKGYPEYFI